MFRSVDRPDGRMGIITPTGLATDATTAASSPTRVETERLAAFYDFENEAKIFAASIIAVSLRGVLPDRWRAGRRGAARPSSPATSPTCRLAGSHLAAGRDPAAQPEHRHPADVPQPRDAEITLGIYRRHPVLIHEVPDATRGACAFATLFHMANDSGSSETAETSSRAERTSTAGPGVRARALAAALRGEAAVALRPPVLDLRGCHTGPAQRRNTPAAHRRPARRSRRSSRWPATGSTEAEVDERHRATAGTATGSSAGATSRVRATRAPSSPSVLPRSAVGHVVPVGTSGHSDASLVLAGRLVVLRLRLRGPPEAQWHAHDVRRRQAARRARRRRPSTSRSRASATPFADWSGRECSSSPTLVADRGVRDRRALAARRTLTRPAVPLDPGAPRAVCAPSSTRRCSTSTG